MVSRRNDYLNIFSYFSQKPCKALELFLDIRDSMAPERADFATAVAQLPDSGHNPSFAEGWRTMRMLPRLIKNFAGYQELRNQTLLDRGMNLGEYYYIHTLAFHWWLGHSPADGADNDFASDHGGGMHIQIDDDSDLSLDSTWRSYNAVVTAMLENQLSTLPPDGDEQTRIMRDALREELEKLDDDLEYVPWRDRLPVTAAACLAPYRDRFESSYEATTNVFDLMTESD